MSTKLRSGGGEYFQGYIVFGILLLQNVVKTEGIEGKKGSKIFSRIYFSHGMVSEAETPVSICANLQFREICEYHRGSFRMKCLDLSDPGCVQRNQKENLGH